MQTIPRKYGRDEYAEAKEAANQLRKLKKGHYCVVDRTIKGIRLYHVLNTTEADGYKVVYHTNPIWEKEGRMTNVATRKDYALVGELVKQGMTRAAIARELGCSERKIGYMIDLSKRPV